MVTDDRNTKTTCTNCDIYIRNPKDESTESFNRVFSAYFNRIRETPIDRAYRSCINDAKVHI